jgi:hypothetical protein
MFNKLFAVLLMVFLFSAGAFAEKTESATTKENYGTERSSEVNKGQQGERKREQNRLKREGKKDAKMEAKRNRKEARMNAKEAKKEAKENCKKSGK